MIYGSSRRSSYAPCWMESHSFTCTHTFYTRKGRARPGTFHPQRLSKRCYLFYRPRKDGSQPICLGVELNLYSAWLNMHLSRCVNQLSYIARQNLTLEIRCYRVYKLRYTLCPFYFRLQAAIVDSPVINTSGSLRSCLVPMYNPGSMSIFVGI